MMCVYNGLVSAYLLILDVNDNIMMCVYNDMPSLVTALMM